MRDICNFIPPTESGGNITYYHFVYETGIKTLKQPFLHRYYHLVLVAKGKGIYKRRSREIPIEAGTLFVVFPNQPYEIIAEDGFTYLYIDFDGSRVEKLFEQIGITESKCVFQNFGNVYDFWFSAVKRVNSENATTLTESVLLYSLSFIGKNRQSTDLKETERFETALEYLEGNYTDPSLSIKKIAGLFFYNEKYFSALFRKRTGKKFTDYLNRLRVDHSLRLLRAGEGNIAVLAESSGFNDPFYFSKVFKRFIGQTPTEYKKTQLKQGQ